MFKQWFLIGLRLSCGAVPPFFLIWHIMGVAAEKYRRWIMLREQRIAMTQNQAQLGIAGAGKGALTKQRSPFQ